MSPLASRILLLFSILLCLQVAHSLMCYDCNSEYDPRCGDPFHEYSIGEVNCSKQEPREHLKNKYKPIICRKTVQKVYGKIRVVRGCGYIPDERDDRECVKRSGTHDVQALYCSCTTDKCNHAGPTMLMNSRNSNLLPLSLAITLLMFGIFGNYFNKLASVGIQTNAKN